MFAENSSFPVTFLSEKNFCIFVSQKSMEKFKIKYVITKCCCGIMNVA